MKAWDSGNAYIFRDIENYYVKGISSDKFKLNQCIHRLPLLQLHFSTTSFGAYLQRSMGYKKLGLLKAQEK